MYNIYFETGSQILKIPVLDCARYLRKFPNLTKITFQIPFKNKFYEYSLSENAFQERFNLNIHELRTGVLDWRKDFIDKLPRKRIEEIFNKYAVVDITNLNS